MDPLAELSKTQRKREMHALQALGEELVALSAERLARIALPEALRDAIVEARRISKWGARRRQLQYIGRLMREVDAGAIRAQLASWKDAAARDTAVLHRAEHWRDRLLQETPALAELLERYPNADAQRVRTLVRNARQEAKLPAPPKSARARCFGCCASFSPKRLDGMLGPQPVHRWPTAKT